VINVREETRMAAETTTIVLVHGAWADATGFDAEIRALRDRGYSAGESQQQLLEKFEGSLVGPSIRPVPFTSPDGSEGVDLYLATEAFHEAFAADVDPETAAVMAATQRPYAAAAFAATPSAPPAWNTVPCWYLLGTEDKAIPPALQRFMAERANATIVEVPASHVSFVSQPEAATQLIVQAVEATATTG
jgi:pimeloyl-ACP methyl ester carboxylesterase